MDSLDAQARRLLDAYKAKASPSVEDADAVWSAIAAHVKEHDPVVLPIPRRANGPANWGWKVAACSAVAAGLLFWAGSSVLPHQMHVLEGASQNDLSTDLRDAQSTERALSPSVPRPRRDRASETTVPALGTSAVNEPLPSKASPSVTEVSSEEGSAMQARPKRRRGKTRVSIDAPAGTRDAARDPTPATTRGDRMATLNEERRLLGQARATLRAGDVSQTLVWVHKHRDAHPEGLLKEEMALLEVRALCQAGPRSAWTRARGRFLAGYPHSPLAAHLDEDCQPGGPESAR